MKLFVAALVLSISTLASAAQISKFPLNDVTLSYEAQRGVLATGTLVSGQFLTNNVNTVDVNSEFQGKLEVDEKGIIRLALKTSGAFVIGQVNADDSVSLFAPYKAYQISERYDAIEKSFGQVDVDYITIDIAL